MRILWKFITLTGLLLTLILPAHAAETAAAILQMNVTKTNLEEIFIELTSGSKTEPKKEGK